MRSYRPPLPEELPADVRAVVDMMRPAYEVDLAALRDDPAALQAMREHFAPFVQPDFEVEVTFAAPAGGRRGPDALLEAWSEWLSVFASYRPRLDEVVDAGDGRVALFGRDAITTREGIELSTPVGAVYELRDGLVARARFFPDEAAARAALG